MERAREGKGTEVREGKERGKRREGNDRGVPLNISPTGCPLLLSSVESDRAL